MQNIEVYKSHVTPSPKWAIVDTYVFVFLFFFNFYIVDIITRKKLPFFAYLTQIYHCVVIGWSLLKVQGILA